MTPTKERALAALLTCANKAGAAKVAGISPRTLRTYLQDPEFRERYRQAFKDVLDDSTRTAQRMMEPALYTLREIMRDQDQPGGVRVQASKTIIDSALKLTDQVDVLDRVADIEERLSTAEGADDYHRKA